MSYDIELVDPVTRAVLQLDQPHHMRGGTYAVGGTTEARLSVTHNYGAIFGRVFPFIDGQGNVSKGIRYIYGLTGEQSIPVLQAAINALGGDVRQNYWEATKGDAKRALNQLLAFAQMRPDGVWTGN